MRSKNEVTDEEYEEFYKFQANDYEAPLMRMHFSADAPLEINSLLFVPKRQYGKDGDVPERKQGRSSLQKVLIDAEPKALFPEWLRFLKGVVDSSGLALDVSRETMQDSELLRKLNQVLTKRFLRFLNEQAKKEEQNYLEFGMNSGLLSRKLLATDFTHREDLAKLLLFESTALDPGKLTGFRCHSESDGQGSEGNFCFCSGKAENRLKQASPRGDARPGLEVLLLTEPVDEHATQSINE